MSTKMLHMFSEYRYFDIERNFIFPITETSQDLSEPNTTESHLTSPNMIYMGCSIVDGRGKGVVVRIGMGTRMGKIAKLLNEVS